MTTNYRDKLFTSYNETHVGYLDQDDAGKLTWFQHYAEQNYLPLLTQFVPGSAQVLDLGCNKGYLLAVLRRLGFQQLHGIDLSPADLEVAKHIAPDAKLACIDATQYLDQNQATFDIIIMKAVLEHIPKAEIIPLLEQMRAGLKPGGMVLIDVPNMDWLFASHERYLDFTHEVGFTQSSLGQILRNVFPQVAIYPVEHITGLSRNNERKKRFARFLIQKLLTWADPQGASNPLWARSIIGVGWNSK